MLRGTVGILWRPWGHSGGLSASDFGTGSLGAVGAVAAVSQDCAAVSGRRFGASGGFGAAVGVASAAGLRVDPRGCGPASDCLRMAAPMARVGSRKLITSSKVTLIRDSGQ